MRTRGLLYWPLAAQFQAALAVILVALIVLLQFGALTYAYVCRGRGRHARRRRSAEPPRIGQLGAPLVSIDGAGTFDGALLSGVAAVLIASL